MVYIVFIALVHLPGRLFPFLGKPALQGDLCVSDRTDADPAVSSEDFLLPICLGPFHGKTFPECLVILGCASLVDAISGRLKDPPCWLDLTQWQIFLSFFSFSKCFVFFFNN